MAGTGLPMVNPVMGFGADGAGVGGCGCGKCCDGCGMSAPVDGAGPRGPVMRDGVDGDDDVDDDALSDIGEGGSLD